MNPTSKISTLFLMIGLQICGSHFTCASAKESTVMLDARIAGDEVRTRFVADLTAILPYAVQLLENPYRVVIDFPLLEFHISTERGQSGRGLVDQWRFGTHSPEKSRIVLDTNQPVKIEKSFMLPSVQGQPARFVVELLKTSPESYTVGLIDKSDSAISKNLRSMDSKKRKQLLDGKKVRPLIVLDPGHGGFDTGAVGSTGIMEKTIVLNFASILRRKIEAKGLFDVLLTRENDQFLSLSERVEFARSNKADLFISLHADSVRQKNVRGASAYTLSKESSDDFTKALVENENRSNLLGGIDLASENEVVGNILYDLAVRETQYLSSQYSQLLIGNISKSTKVLNNPERSGGFLVLKAPDVPSVLLELGYLSNKEDETLLISDEWKNITADTVASSVEEFFKKTNVKQ